MSTAIPTAAPINVLGGCCSRRCQNDRDCGGPVSTNVPSVGVSAYNWSVVGNTVAASFVHSDSPERHMSVA